MASRRQRLMSESGNVEVNSSMDWEAVSQYSQATIMSFEQKEYMVVEISPSGAAQQTDEI